MGIRFFVLRNALWASSFAPSEKARYWLPDKLSRLDTMVLIRLFADFFGHINNGIPDLLDPSL